MEQACADSTVPCHFLDLQPLWTGHPEYTASDGVQHVVYSLYPVIPTTKNLNANMGPGYTDACKNSPVHCVLVDLEPLFKGQHFGSDNTHPDSTGAKIIGDAWWKAMQDNCIGQ